jgi:hypothetical protein
MSDILSAPVIKATKGEYDIPIKNLWLETWRQLLQMPKTFWQAFGLIILILLGMGALFGLPVRFYDDIYFFVHYFSSHTPSHVRNAFISYMLFFGGAILEIFRCLLTTSLAYLALHHIRTQPTKVTMVFAFLKNWQNLLLISVLLYLVRGGVELLPFLFRTIHLNPFLPQGLSKPIIALAHGLRGFLVIFLYTYFMLVAFMASLLILDQKLTLKNSLYCACKSINQHWFKNSVLLFLPAWAYMCIGTDSIMLFYAVGGGFALFAYLIFLSGMIMAILFILYKNMADQTNLSHIKKIALIIIKVSLGLVILELFFSGVGLIWLLPVIALLIAIQYQHIFGDNHLAYV